MKKMLLALMAFMSVSFAMNAQSATPTQPNPTHKPATKAETKKVAPAVAEKHAANASTKEVAHLKKDGTPDKRYKNSEHLKKDGTPDKRYKENKKS